VDYEDVARGWQRLHKLFPVTSDHTQTKPATLLAGAKELQRAYTRERRALDTLCEAFPEVAAIDDAWSWSA